jgi:hypothetical protein
MSEIQEIDVFVQPDGTVRIEVRGVTGQKCLDVTAKLETLLGGAVVERTHTDEFYQAEQQQTQNDWLEQRGG